MAISESHDEGWKTCTWSRLVDVMLRSEALVPASSVVVGEGSLEMSRLRITLARRGTLKWWRGSRRMMALEWPLRAGIEGCVDGRMAWAMRR